MAIEEEELGMSRDFHLTETTVDPSVTVPQLVAFLQRRKTTGQLIFHLSQGSIQKAQVVEKSKIAVED